ncbi:MAG: MotA/TolQ/ExbB proton channel family protein [Rickettsiales bacterium]
MLNQLSIIQILLDADLIAKFIILVLLIFSIWSWSIIFKKYFEYGIAIKKNQEFYNIFMSSRSIEHMIDKSKRINENVCLRILNAGLSEISRANLKDSEMKQSARDRMLQTITIIKNKYSEKLEESLAIIGTIGSNAPFIGLLGMVWSVVNGFYKMSAAKQATITVLVPNLIEAFIVTAIGLAVAIPSMIMYEMLVTKLEQINNDLNNNTLEIYNLLSEAIDETNFNR